MTITDRQIRQARIVLGLEPNELAVKVRMISTATIVRAELIDGEPLITVAQAAAIRSFFETAGILFPEKHSEGSSVKLRQDTDREHP